MIVAEKLVRYLVRLYSLGASLPDGQAPTKLSRSPDGAKRLRVKNSFGGRLSPTRCGLPAAQTRGTSSDRFTAQDVAASLCAIKDETTRAMVEWMATPWWREDQAKRMVAVLAKEVRDKFPDSKCWTPVMNSVVLTAAVLNELRTADGCSECKTYGLVYFPQRKEWAPCTVCGGSGNAQYGYRKRTAALAGAGINITEHQFRTYWHPPYQWLTNRCNERAVTAWHQIRRDR